MKNKIKTNNNSFQSYLNRATNENFEKMKEDRYSYDEVNFLTKAATKVKRLFKRKKTGDERTAEIKAKKEAVKSQTGSNIGKRITDAYEEVKKISKLVTSDFAKIFDEYKEAYDAEFKRLKDAKKPASFPRVFYNVIKEYIKVMIDRVKSKFKFNLFGESVNYDKRNIFMEAKTPTYSVNMDGQVVTGIFIYILQGVEYELNTYTQRLTVKKFSAYTGVPNIETLWNIILVDPNVRKKVNTAGQFIEFNPKIFETEIYPFLKGEGDVAIVSRAKSIKTDDQNLKIRTADTNRRIKKIESRTNDIDDRTQRIETSQANTDRRINIIMYIGIALLVLVVAGIAFGIYAYLKNQARLDDIELQNQVADSVNAQRFGFLSTRMDEIEIKVDKGFETVQQQLVISDQINASRYSSLQSTVIDAKKEIISTISQEVEDAKRKIINRISKSSSALANLMQKNNNSLISVKSQIANLKIQIGNDQAAVLKAIGMTKEELLEEMKKNSVDQKEIAEYLNSKLDKMGETVDEANGRIIKVADGLVKNGEAGKIGYIENFLTGKADQIREAAIQNFSDASKQVPENVGTVR